MSIQVKNINNILVIRCFDETDFSKYLDEIEKLLDLPLFNKECFFLMKMEIYLSKLLTNVVFLYIIDLLN